MADEKIIVPKDRVFERGQGCWNCVHGTHATEFWTEKRKADVLAIKSLLTQDTAKPLLTDADLVEAASKSKNPSILRRLKMLDTVDHSVAAHALLRCTKGKLPNGDPVGDLVAHNYLCSQWTGQQGASLARQGNLDALPEELVDKLDGQPSMDLENLIGKKLIDN